MRNQRTNGVRGKEDQSRSLTADMVIRATDYHRTRYSVGGSGAGIQSGGGEILRLFAHITTFGYPTFAEVRGRPSCIDGIA